VSYRNEIGDYSERVKALETEKSAKDAEIAELTEQIARLKSDGERELRRKERLEKDVKDMKVMLEKKQEEVRQKQLAVNQGEEELGRQALKLRELEFQAQKAHKENDGLSQKTQRLQQELEEQINTNNQLLTENNQRQIELKTKDDEIAAVKSQAIKDSRMRDQLKKKIKEQEDARGEVEKQRDMLKQEILQLEREIEEQRRQIEIDRKTIEEMGRERDLLQNNLRKTESATSKQADLVKIQENTRKNLEVEIQGYVPSFPHCNFVTICPGTRPRRRSSGRLSTAWKKSGKSMGSKRVMPRPNTCRRWRRSKYVKAQSLSCRRRSKRATPS
jgi:chromosome segregation ATPase